MSPMASYIGLLKSRFEGSVESAATAVDIEEAAVAVEDDTLPRWNSVGGRTWENLMGGVLMNSHTMGHGKYFD